MRRACPDPLLDGVERIVGASGGTGVFGAAQEAAPKDAGDAMAYREILRAAARGQTPLLIHGVSGRGATGIASMLLLKMLGVSDEDAIGDYLLSNRYCAGAKLERKNAENFLARVRAPLRQRLKIISSGRAASGRRPLRMCASAISKRRRAEARRKPPRPPQHEKEREKSCLHRTFPPRPAISPKPS